MNYKSMTKAQLIKEIELLKGKATGDTESKHTEEVLQEREETIRYLAENSQDWIWAMDLEGVHTYQSHAIKKILGYEPDELVGKLSLDLMHEDDRKMVEAKLPQLIAEKCGWHDLVIRWRHKNGTWRYLESTAVPILDSKGELTGFRGIDRDITERRQAEDALKESEERFRNLMEYVPGVSIQGYDLEGKVLYWNKASEEVYGYTAREALGKNLADLIIPADVMPHFEMALEIGKGIEKSGEFAPPGELDLLHKNGHLVPVYSIHTAVKHEDKAPILFCIDVDLSERKKKEDALHESEEKYRAIFEQAADSIVLIDPVTENLVAFNDRAHESLGYSREEFKELKIPDFEIIESADEVRSHIEKITRNGFDTFETEHRTKGGDIRNIHVSCRVISIMGRNFIQSVWHDITERRRAELALRESEEELRDFFDNANDLIQMVTPEGRFAYVNRKWLNVLGYTREELADISFIDVIHSDSKEHCLELFQRIMTGERIDFVEAVFLTKDGRQINVEGSVSCRFEEDKPVNTRGIFRDVTERKILEEQLQQMQKMESIGRLAGGVAHDFNNMLTVISGHAELALTRLNSENPLVEDITEIQIAAQRASNLTKQLLAFSRKQTLEPKVLNLNYVITDMDKMLRRIIGEDIDLLTVYEPELWRVKVDPGQIEQVVVNLVVNGRDAMSRGGKLTIETMNMELDDDYTHSHPEVEPGSYVMIAVTDTGVGMSEEIVARIFDPFFTTKEVDKGTGLGLSTVYGIIKQSGGHIWVYSEINKGTTFKVYFPIVSEDAELFIRKGDVDEVPRGAETILVVEDEDSVRDLACRILKIQGYKVLEAQNGGEAYLMCKKLEKSVDLVVTDVVMPGISGAEFVEKLREIWDNVKVLYMSGYTADAIVHDGILVPGTHYIQKPYRSLDLARKVREVLDE